MVQPGIAIPQNTISVTVNAQGQVNATVAGNTTPQTVGQLELTRFPNEAGLNSIGNNLYLETPGFRLAPGRRFPARRLRNHPAGLSGNLQRQLG